MSRRRARRWPDSRKVEAKFGIAPASEIEGMRAYLVARDLGLANDIRSWDRSETRDGDWQIFCPGLTDDEKLRWRLVAGASR